MEEEFNVSKDKKGKIHKRKKWISEKVELFKRMKKTIKEVLLDNIFSKTYKDAKNF